MKNYNLTTKASKEVLAVRQETEMVFQQFNLFKHKDALNNVMEGLRVVKKLPKAEARRIAVAELEKVGMSDRLHHCKSACIETETVTHG